MRPCHRMQSYTELSFGPWPRCRKGLSTPKGLGLGVDHEIPFSAFLASPRSISISEASAVRAALGRQDELLVCDCVMLSTLAAVAGKQDMNNSAHRLLQLRAGIVRRPFGEPERRMANTTHQLPCKVATHVRARLILAETANSVNDHSEHRLMPACMPGRSEAQEVYTSIPAV